MSDTSVRSQNAKATPSTRQKLAALKGDDLQLVAERLALIQGHINRLPNFCISGVTIIDGFLLVALKVEGHELSVEGGSWMLDKKDVTLFS